MPLTSEHETEFLRAFAKAILSWQHVESRLALIFNVLACREDDKTAISATFNAVISLEVRLAMTDAVSNVVLRDNGPLLEQWKSVEKRIKIRSQARNKLAHLSAVAVHDAEGAVELMLMPSMYKSATLKKSQTHKISLRQIIDDQTSFKTLAEELNNFLGRLIQYKPLP